MSSIASLTSVMMHQRYNNIIHDNNNNYYNNNNNNKRRFPISEKSLPLKKRKFSLQTTGPTEPTEPTDHWDPQQQQQSRQPESDTEPSLLATVGDDEREQDAMAALALIASAASTVVVTSDKPSPTSSNNHRHTIPSSSSTSSTTSSTTSHSHSHSHSHSVVKAPKSEPSTSSSSTKMTCQGLTSRQVKCKRFAGFNGSNFCKWHYHHHEQQQDKKYTGNNPNETRCQATTVRGRKCTHVAVNESSYCRMHSRMNVNSYAGNDNNTSSNTSCGTISSGSSPAPSPPPCVFLESAKAESNAEANAEATRTTPTVPNIRTTPFYPYPLLSMISTEEWHRKHVIIATGPFANQIGQVQKWGNGWVSLTLLDKDKTHNRRSFELYVAPVRLYMQHRASTPTRDILATTATAVTPLVTTNRPTISSTYLKPTFNAPVVTPRPKDNTSNKAEAASTSSGDSRMMPLPVLANPPVVSGCNQDQEYDHETAHKSTNNDENIYQYKNGQNKDKPSDQKDDRSSLLQTLLMAQKGHRTPEYNLLFGTAAMGRSRRHVHKPERYEDCFSTLYANQHHNHDHHQQHQTHEHHKKQHQRGRLGK